MECLKELPPMKCGNTGQRFMLKTAGDEGEGTESEVQLGRLGGLHGGSDMESLLWRGG